MTECKYLHFQRREWVKVKKISTWVSVNISVRLVCRSRISGDGGRGMGAVGWGEDIPQGTPHIPRCLETFTIGFVFVRSLKQGVATL